MSVTAGAIDRIIGERIRAKREALGFTPSAFAARLGCSPGLVLDYESGRARTGAITLIKLAELCGVDLAYFLSGLGEAPCPAEPRHQSSLS